MPLSKNPRQSVDILRLGSAHIQDSEGQSFPIKKLWEKRQTVVLIFVRHFACIACRAHVSQLIALKQQFQDSQSRLVFIGHGYAEAIEGFKESLKLDDTAEIYTDPSRESFKACAFKKDFLNLVNLKTIQNATRLFKAGHRQSKYDKSQGIHRQMGGVVVVQPDEKVSFHFISEALGDFPPEEAILEKSKQRGVPFR